MTEFEIFLHLCSILAFTVLLCLKLDSIYDLDWFNVFLPLFVVDLLQANFCSILFIRQFLQDQRKMAVFRLILAGMLLLARFIFKYLTYQFVSSSAAFKFQVAAIPVYFHLIILMFKTCGLKKHHAIY
ncbi:transmembrane protein -like [Brachionus plicatilis]|uniref:Transmembrane protein-like n=1 Tax=Brachionus plicatilis TaxID=10195 RepID=A0A3M7R1X4_BRAPC|nr:transmembrane protein -like [Brachionus plicatilis]